MSVGWGWGCGVSKIHKGARADTRTTPQIWLALGPDPRRDEISRSGEPLTPMSILIFLCQGARGLGGLGAMGLALVNIAENQRKSKKVKENPRISKETKETIGKS